jgi:hypothetical protein
MLSLTSGNNGEEPSILDNSSFVKYTNLKGQRINASFLRFYTFSIQTRTIKSLCSTILLPKQSLLKQSLLEGEKQQSILKQFGLNKLIDAETHALQTPINPLTLLCNNPHLLFANYISPSPKQNYTPKS